MRVHSFASCCSRRALMARRRLVRPPRRVRVVATTEDLGLARARSRRRQGRRSSALAKGYQDPHFVDPKPSFILAVSRADLLIVVGPRAGDRLAAAAHHQQPQREDSAGRATATSTRRRTCRSWRSRPGKSRARWATCTRRATRTTGSTRATAAASRRRSSDKLSQLSPADAAYFDAALRGLRQAAGRGREALGRGDGALQGHQDRHVSPLVAELHGALRPGRDGLRRAEAGHSADHRRTRSSSSTR